MAETRDGRPKYCFRQLPWTSAACVAGKWQMEDVALLGKRDPLKAYTAN